MKTVGNSDSSSSSLPSAATESRSLAEYRRTHGRRLEVAQDSELVDLLHAYEESSRAQFDSLIATSRAVVQDVAYFRGLRADHPDAPYDCVSFTETITRHSAPDHLSSDDTQAGGEAEVGTDREAPPTGSADLADVSAASPGQPTSTCHTGACRFTGELSAAEARAWSTALAQVEAESGKDLSRGKGRKKNRAAGRLLRRVRRLAQELLDNPAPLPDFPGFDPKLTFYSWLRTNVEPTDAGVYSSLLGATTSNSLRFMTSSMTFAQGLPKFRNRCLAGDFTIEHVDCVTRACRDLNFEHFPAVDEFLSKRRADTTIETFRRSLGLKIAATQPPEETLKSIALRRRVDFSAGDDGTAYLTLTGPAPEVQACYRRLDAFARAVYKSNTSAFSKQLNGGDCFDDDRSISALMFDILTRTRPQLKLRIISTNTSDGESTSSDFPIDGLFAGPDGVPMHEGEALLDYIDRVFDDMEAKGYGSDEDSEAAGDQARSSRDQAEPGSDCAENSRDHAERGEEDSPHRAASTPADRVFESQLLDAILSSRTTADSTAAEGMNQAEANELADTLSSLIGSRSSGARPASEGTEAAAHGAVDAFGAPIRGEGENRISFEFLLDMPTNEYWLSNQARTFVTVPMLTLLSQFQDEDDGDSDTPSNVHTPPAVTTHAPGPPAVTAHAPDPPAATSEPLASEEVCDLAGMLPDGSPIPAEMARRLAGYSNTWTRLLTDPAAGTPIDAKAMTYAIPNSVRKTLVAQFVTCTFPGCTRAAETSEVDHIDPFDHSDPRRGGLTRFGNLHCLCKLHHQQKTDGKFDLRMTVPGHLEYVFRRGTTVEVVAPDNPLNVEHARILLERFGSGLPRPNRPIERGHSTSAKQEKSAKTAFDETTPSPGERRRAPSCPEPAAADGKPGWKEADPSWFAVLDNSVLADPDPGRPDADPYDEPVPLRDWFWDSGEPPPF